MTLKLERSANPTAIGVFSRKKVPHKAAEQSSGAEFGKMKIPESLRNILDSQPEIVSGAVCFKGTRVPVQALFDTLDDGDGLSAFLEGYPAVAREQAEAVVHWQQNQARLALGLDLAS